MKIVRCEHGLPVRELRVPTVAKVRRDGLDARRLRAHRSERPGTAGDFVREAFSRNTIRKLSSDLEVGRPAELQAQTLSAR